MDDTTERMPGEYPLGSDKDKDNPSKLWKPVFWMTGKIDFVSQTMNEMEPINNNI